VHGFAFGFPLHLEVGFWIEEGVFGPFDAFELGEGIDLFAAPLEVFFVIGHEEEFAAWLQDALDCVQEIDLHESAAVVPCLWPGIGAEEVQA